MRPPLPLLLCCCLLAAPAAAQDAPDTVRLPLDHWRQVLDQLDTLQVPLPAPEPVLQVDRAVVGSFHKGVLAATLTTTFEVPPGAAPVRVPILDATTSIRSVRLDGQQTSLLHEGEQYTVGVASPGRHTVVVEFLQGREDDRFTRALGFRLPPAGPTRLDLVVPEADIDASLGQGAITGLRPIPGGTRILGQLDARGQVDLAWKRRPTRDGEGDGEGAASAAPVRTTAHVDTLFTLHEALVRGVAAVDLSVQEGETDRLDLVVPPEVEVVDVTGDAVLQWRTEDGAGPDDPDRLAVLLRYLVDDRAQVQVHFQVPVDIDQGGPVALRLPLPAEGTPTEGTIGLQGPAGLEVAVQQVEGAEALTLRDLPPGLTELTQSPLLMGFRFDEVPTLSLALSRTAEVELTSTIVDDVQASTVLLEDGDEVGKLRLRMRNNTRQYLEASLPPGAVLTHAFIDGQAIRPAVADPARPEALLLPLRQSERLEGGQAVTWTVRPGDTLSGIAAATLGSPTAWDRLLAENADQLASAWDLEPGQVLRIPAQATGSLQESSFVVELAYKVPGDPLGLLGSRQVQLPGLDVDVVSVTWHLYTPQALAPLGFQANLTQVSGLRYDPFRRAGQFLRRALTPGSAWAGGEYQSILSQRKQIWRDENMTRQGGPELTSDFPYVGELTRFQRLLPGQETPRIRYRYVDRDALPAVRLGALALAFGLTGWLLQAPRDRRRQLALALGLVLLLGVAHTVLGVHRRILWGVDLALALDVARHQGGSAFAAARRRLASPGALLDLLSWRNLAATVALAFGLLLLGAFPMLLSSAALALLLAARRLR